jgi:hypothetical protein
MSPDSASLELVPDSVASLEVVAPDSEELVPDSKGLTSQEQVLESLAAPDSVALEPGTCVCTRCYLVHEHRQAWELHTHECSRCLTKTER